MHTNLCFRLRNGTARHDKIRHDTTHHVTSRHDMPWRNYHRTLYTTISQAQYSSHGTYVMYLDALHTILYTPCTMRYALCTSHLIIRVCMSCSRQLLVQRVPTLAECRVRLLSLRCHFFESQRLNNDVDAWRTDRRLLFVTRGRTITNLA